MIYPKKRQSNHNKNTTDKQNTTQHIIIKGKSVNIDIDVFLSSTVSDYFCFYNNVNVYIFTIVQAIHNNYNSLQ